MSLFHLVVAQARLEIYRRGNASSLTYSLEDAKKMILDKYPGHEWRWSHQK